MYYECMPFALVKPNPNPNPYTTQLPKISTLPSNVNGIVHTYKTYLDAYYYINSS